MSADEFTDLLVTTVHGVAGGTKAGWRKAIGAVERAIGAVERLSTWRTVTHNWQVAPTGSAAQRETIERAVAVVRAERPDIG